MGHGPTVSNCRQAREQQDVVSAVYTRLACVTVTSRPVACAQAVMLPVSHSVYVSQVMLWYAELGQHDTVGHIC